MRQVFKKITWKSGTVILCVSFFGSLALLIAAWASLLALVE